MYLHGYPAEEKHRAQADSGHEPLKRFVPWYRDNRAELSPTWTVPINYPGSRNPLRTSYVMYDGESIKGKETKRSGNN